MPSTEPATSQVDVRGPRFSAWLTTAVLVAVLLLFESSPAVAAIVLAGQAVVFAAGAVWGPRRHPYGVLYRRVVAPRLGPVTAREPVAPLRFAQLVGLVLAVIGIAGFVFAPMVGLIATAFALAAAFLNAAFDICLGCQLYPLVVRLRRTPAAGLPTTSFASK